MFQAPLRHEYAAMAGGRWHWHKHGHNSEAHDMRRRQGCFYGARWWEEWIETQPHIGGFYSFEELPSAEPRNSSCASGKLLNRTVNGTLDCPNSAILLGRIEFPGRSLLSHAS
ncbi:hypothetical protein KL912_002797 [Ogataea haglerorum]|nr:hypothetical protein KL912_002797 [Ogataea haglerorum]